MALNILVFVGLFFFLGAIGALIGAAWAAAASNKVAVGNLVRTTFTACPTVLTTALWGPAGEYAFSNSYGPSDIWAQDATNALHCDMPGARGVYSSWLSGAGQAKPGIGGAIASNSTIYWTGKGCSTDADCSGPTASLTINCGPGWNLIEWNTTNNQQAPFAFQCPGSNGSGKGDVDAVSWCSVCAGQPGFNTATGLPFTPGTAWGGCDPANIDPNAIGTCMGVANSIPYKCAFETPQYIGGGNGTNRQCAAFTDPGQNPGTGANTYTAPFGQYLSCSIQNNWSSTANVSDVCNPAHPGYSQYAPYVDWLCKNKGNSDCPAGQQCVANWNASVTGWCIPGDPCPSCPNSTDPNIPGVCEPTPYVCSGTVLPNTVMQTLWIAEGQVVSQNDDGSFEVQWNRVQNTYNGIGPSVNYVFPGPKQPGGGYLNTFSREATEDLTWRYADCRFVADSGSITSRNTSVSNALLGFTYVDQTTGIVQSASNPLGFAAFNDTNVFTPSIDALLKVQVFSYCPSSYQLGYNGTQGTFGPTPAVPGFPNPPSQPEIGLTSNGFQGKWQVGPGGGQIAKLSNGVPCNPLSRAAVTSAATLSDVTGYAYQPAINTVWNLQAHEVDPSQLKRIFFYSILPFNVTDETLAVYSQSYYLAPANDMMLGKPPRF